jgi:hypothetical protein
MKLWVKLYTEILDDPDQGTLTWAERGIWSALLALAGKLDHRERGYETGRLDTLERVAWHLRCSLDELSSAITAFTERGMVDERDGILYVTNYAKRQARPPSARPEAVAERVRRYRERQANGNEVDTTPEIQSNENDTKIDVSSNEDVTTLHPRDNEPVTRYRIELDLDSESAANAAPHAPEPPPKSKKPPKKPIPPAVQAFRRAAHRFPAKSWWPDVDQIVVTDAEDLEFWEQCVKAYVGLGWNPTNVKNMLEFYRRREIPNGKARDGPRRQTVAEAWEIIEQETGFPANQLFAEAHNDP